MSNRQNKRYLPFKIIYKIILANERRYRESGKTDFNDGEDLDYINAIVLAQFQDHKRYKALPLTRTETYNVLALNRANWSPCSKSRRRANLVSNLYNREIVNATDLTDIRFKLDNPFIVFNFDERFNDTDPKREAKHALKTAVAELNKVVAKLDEFE